MEKNKIKLLLSLGLLLLLTSCNDDSRTSFPVLDAEKAINNSRSFNISKYIDTIKYISLETNKNCLVGEIVKIIKTKDYFFISDKQGQLFLFNSIGKFVRRIGAKGKAPGEYNFLEDFIVDEQSFNVYVSCNGQLINYGFNGIFKKKILIGSTDLQVLTNNNNKQLFYIMPDTKQSNSVNSIDLVYIYDMEGKVIKKFESKTVRDHGIPAYFNSIYSKNDNVYYKEEFGKAIYKINSKLIRDSIFSLDLGNYGFNPEDFDFSSANKWKKHYRLNKLFVFDHLIFFNLQKGLMGKDISTLIWNKKDRKLIFPHDKANSEKKGIYIGRIKITPISDYKKELVAKVSIQDLLDNKDKLSKDLKNVIIKIDENSNPVLAVLKIK